MAAITNSVATGNHDDGLDFQAGSGSTITVTDAVVSGSGDGVDEEGGPTLTHLPQDNSPAVEAGDPAFTGLTTDQRDQDRVVNRLDMGAVEVQPMLAATGADATVPIGGGILLLGAGALLIYARRRSAETKNIR